MNNKYENPLNIATSKEFLLLAYKDYIAARHLLRNEMLLQGTILASTCLEKYFKAILILKSKRYTKHLSQTLCNEIKDFDGSLYNKLDQSFLNLLIKCYRLRYLDNITDTFSVILVQYQLLAELDYTVSKIEGNIHIYQNDQKLILNYEQAWREKDKSLVDENHIYHGVSSDKFIQEKESFIYCIRIDPNLSFNKTIIESHGHIAKQPIDKDFMREFKISDYPTEENPKTGFLIPFKLRNS
ncbi:MAG TPA: hypothetical protein PLT08_10755 [Anaerolineales bacterium]|nr:hypothetical protein [Anaerolineales bacterium]